MRRWSALDGQLGKGRQHVFVLELAGDHQRQAYPAYVMETPVLFPTKNRTFYSLIYATRSSKGVEVFRECQHAPLKAQDEVRADLQVTRREDLFGMADMFGGTITGSGFADFWMAEQDAAAKAALLDGVPDAPASIAWGDLWPRVLARHGIRRTRLGRMAAELRSENRIEFLGWAPRKQVPDDAYRATRPPVEVV